MLESLYQYKTDLGLVAQKVGAAEVPSESHLQQKAEQIQHKLGKSIQDVQVSVKAVGKCLMTF